MINVEFLIVGNGLAGTLLAFEMLDHKLDFKILVSKEISKASLIAAGMFNPLVFKRMTKSWMADELIPVMKCRYSELERRLNKEFIFEKELIKPLSAQELPLWIERSNDIEFARYIKSIDKVKKYACLKDAYGYGVVSNSGYVDMPIFLEAAEMYLNERNFIINGVFPFSKYDPLKKDLEIGQYKFSKIIFCEGYHVTRNYFFNFLPLKPVKGEVLEIHSPVISEDYILNKKVFVLPIGNQTFKVGSTYEWEDLSEMPTSDGKESILTRLDELISADFDIVKHVAGIRPTVSDRRPVLGKHPGKNQLFIFNGLGTKGVMLGPYFAREMLRILTEKDYETLSDVQIERFL